MNVHSRKRPGRKGFTLVEVLLVLAILVILTSVVSFAVVPAMKKARIRRAKTDINTISGFLDGYYTDVGSYPFTQQGLQALTEVPPDLADKSKWGGPYPKKPIPEDPWGRPYQYTCEDGETFVLFSFGPDGQAGSEDDIK